MPRIVDHDERRREIADALLELIAEHGIAGATIRSVADRCNWSTGVISHYFRNRHALLIGGLRRANELAANRHREISTKIIGRQAVEAILESVMPLDKSRLSLNRIFVFFYAEAVVDPVVTQEIERYLAKWRRQVFLAVKDAQDLNEIDPDLDAEVVARDLVCLADGLTIHALFDNKIIAKLAETSPIRLWTSRLAPKAQAAKKKIPQRRR